MKAVTGLGVFFTVGLAVLVGMPAWAFINPEFTPIDVVEQSDTILRVQVKQVKDKPEMTIHVQETLKGDAPARDLVLELEGAWNEDHILALERIVSAVPDDSSIFFAGTLEGQQDVGLMHVGGSWFRASAGKDSKWELEGMDTQLQGTWAGGTDMLIRVVRYVLTDPYPVVPVSVGTAWDQIEKIGKLTGKATALKAVDLKGNGKLYLFLASEAGDQLFQYVKEGDTFEEISSQLKLASKSRCADWADFNGDGKLDLASIEGKALKLWLQKQDGTFAVKQTSLPALPADTLAISALDVSSKGRPGLLLSTPSTPLLLVPTGDGSFKVLPIPAPAELSKKLGEAGKCLVADLDADTLVDILQLRRQGSILYRGKAPGVFGVGSERRVALGEDPAGAFLGDFDGDGVLDIFTAGAEMSQVWQNNGNGTFTGVAELSGSVAYIARPGGIGGAVCDINSDGRQDLLIGYAEDFPQVFFNRAFRCFGFAFQLSLDEPLPEASQGQQAVAAADLNGDGAHDVVLVLKSGDIYVLAGQSAAGETLCVRAVLDGSSAVTGPVTVTAWVENFCLGAWNVARGSAGAYFGMSESGPCKLKWQFPGGKVQQKEVMVEDEPVRFTISPEG